MAKSNTCNKWPDVPMFDQLIASDQDVLGTPAESYPWQKGDPILAPRRWYLLSGFLQKMMDFCGRCLSFRNDFIWAVYSNIFQQWWLWMVKLWGFHQGDPQILVIAHFWPNRSSAWQHHTTAVSLGKQISNLIPPKLNTPYINGTTVPTLNSLLNHGFWGVFNVRGRDYFRSGRTGNDSQPMSDVYDLDFTWHHCNMDTPMMGHENRWMVANTCIMQT